MKGLWKENLSGYIKDCKRKKQPKSKFFRENLKYNVKLDFITPNIWNLGFIYYRNSNSYQKIVNKQDRTIQRNWLNKQDFNFWLENKNYYNFLTEEVDEFLYNYDFRYAFYILDNECRSDIGLNCLPTH
jgi:hypothetical protein